MTSIASPLYYGTPRRGQLVHIGNHVGVVAMIYSITYVGGDLGGSNATLRQVTWNSLPLLATFVNGPTIMMCRPIINIMLWSFWLIVICNCEIVVIVRGILQF